MIFVNYEDCSGCGACMEACEYDAIFLQNDKATIDQERCEGCQACMEACPSGAIQSTEKEIQPATIMMKANPAPVEVRRDQAPTPIHFRSTILPVLGSVLLWTGQELAPRLANLALRALDQRIASADQGTQRNVQTNTHGRNRIASKQGNGRRRRLRQRRNRRM